MKTNSTGILTLPLLLLSFLILSCSTSKTMKYQLTKNYHPDDQELYETIVKLDSTFFGLYNTCEVNLDKYGAFYSDSVLFYHDKGGLSNSKQEIIDAAKRNICGKVKRVLVKGSIEVYPIKGFGAVEIGLHQFQSESLSKPGRFMIIWENKNKEWKIKEVISLH